MQYNSDSCRNFSAFARKHQTRGTKLSVVLCSDNEVQRRICTNFPYSERKLTRALHCCRNATHLLRMQEEWKIMHQRTQHFYQRVKNYTLISIKYQCMKSQYRQSKKCMKMLNLDKTIYHFLAELEYLFHIEMQPKWSISTNSWEWFPNSREKGITKNHDKNLRLEGNSNHIDCDWTNQLNLLVTSY